MGLLFALLFPVLFVVVLLTIKTFFVVDQQTTAIIERFGKFHSTRKPGLHIKIPFVDRIADRINMRICQLDVRVETKTQDNVFIGIQVSVQYYVIEEAVYDAYYKLEDPTNQITSYIFDVVRAEVPKMKLDDVFAKKDDVAVAIRQELQEAMQNYGYRIEKALVTDIEPDMDVKHAMNRINAAEREKIAAEFEAEAARIKIVATARAEAESKKLQGQGIADQRREIAKGLEESIQLLNNANVPATDASMLVMITQYFDTLQSIGANSNSNLILLPNSPEAASNMLANMTAAFASAGKVDTQ